MTQTEKVLYTAQTHTVGNRETGASRSSDGQLEVTFATPGTGRPGTNPEQLFAAGWSACFFGAIGIVAAKKRIKLPAESSIDTEVDLVTDSGQYFIQARLNVSLPGIDPATARELVEGAHEICPYSKATRGNINVTLNVI